VNIKIGDIICRTSIADRIVINKDGKLCTVKISNGQIQELNLDGFDVVKRSVYDNSITASKYILAELQKHFPDEISKMYNSNQLRFEDIFYKANNL
jgi:hypothetical protein